MNAGTGSGRWRCQKTCRALVAPRRMARLPMRASQPNAHAGTSYPISRGDDGPDFGGTVKTFVLAVLLSLVPSAVSAATPVWPQGECAATANRNYVCGLNVLTCEVEWTADTARSDGLESGLRCQALGIVRYIVVDRLGIVLLDTGNTAGADVVFEPTSVVHGDYLEVMITYSSSMEDKAAIAYFNVIHGRFEIVYSTTEPVFQISMTVSMSPSTTIRECDRTLEWSATDREFVLVQGPRNHSLCSYDGDD